MYDEYNTHQRLSSAPLLIVSTAQRLARHPSQLNDIETGLLRNMLNTYQLPSTEIEALFKSPQSNLVIQEYTEEERRELIALMVIFVFHAGYPSKSQIERLNNLGTDINLPNYVDENFNIHTEWLQVRWELFNKMSRIGRTLLEENRNTITQLDLNYYVALVRQTAELIGTDEDSDRRQVAVSYAEQPKLDWSQQQDFLPQDITRLYGVIKGTFLLTYPLAEKYSLLPVMRNSLLNLIPNLSITQRRKLEEEMSQLLLEAKNIPSKR